MKPFFILKHLGTDEHGHSHALFINRREHIQSRWDERRMQRRMRRSAQALQQVLEARATSSTPLRKRI